MLEPSNTTLGHAAETSMHFLYPYYTALRIMPLHVLAYRILEWTIQTTLLCLCLNHLVECLFRL